MLPVEPAAAAWPPAPTDLFDALARNDVPAFQQLLEEVEVDQASRDAQGNTPLHAAVQSGNVQLVSAFVHSRHGRNAGVLHALDARGVSALWSAAHHGHGDMVALLKEAGADINARGKQGETPLTDAVTSHRLEMVMALIAAGADVNACNDVAPQHADEGAQNTPLMLAMRVGKLDVVAALIAAQADVNACNDILDTPLTFARFYDVQAANADEMSAAMLALMAAGANPMVRHFTGFEDTALAHLAARCTRLNAVLTGADAGTGAAAHGRLLALVQAAESGDLARVNALLAGGVQVNARVEKGATALSSAACFGHEKIVRALIDAGADVNVTDGFGQSPLMLAARKSQPGAELAHLGVVNALIAAGANVNARDSDGSTALMLDGVLCRWSTHITIALVKAGVNVDARSYRGETALLGALRLGVPGLASLLMQLGADINLPCHRGWNALMYVVKKAMWNGPAPLINAAADVHARNNRGQTALFIAGIFRREAAVAALVQGGAEVDAVDHRGVTPLMAAAEGGSLGTAAALVQAGASVQAVDKTGATVLMHAARHGRQDIMALLLGRIVDGARARLSADVWPAPGRDARLARDAGSMAAKAAVNARDFAGNTVLMHAAGAENAAWNSLGLLLAAGADVNAQNDAGLTPLMILVRHRDPSAAIRLLEWGGNHLQAVDARKMSALMHAAAQGRKEVLLRLLQAGAHLDILDDYPYIDARDAQGLTPLMHATLNGHLSVATALLDSHADINARDLKGATALMYAAKAGRLGLVTALLGRNAEINAEDGHSHTALLHAALRGHEAVVKALEARGALAYVVKPIERR